MNRHNVGFMAVDVIAEMHTFGPVQKKFQGWIQEGRIGELRTARCYRISNMYPDGIGSLPSEEPPPGFRLTESRVRTLPGSDHPVEHLVYSDGLASVSVFVEPSDATDQALSGLSRMGAAHAFTLILDGQQITAVGEVPPNTVERIARSLRAAEVPAN